jgi:hypothetical protein
MKGSRVDSGILAGGLPVVACCDGIAETFLDFRS